MEYNSKNFEAIIATPGCGKTYLCEKYPNRFVDCDEVRLNLKYDIPKGITRAELERTKGDRPYPKRKDYSNFNEELFKILDNEVKNGKILITSPHDMFFEYFKTRNINFCFVYPKSNIRFDIKQRFINRGNNQKFIETNDGNFEDHIIKNKKENRAICKYEFDKNEYLMDIVLKFGVKLDL